MHVSTLPLRLARVARRTAVRAAALLAALLVCVGPARADNGGAPPGVNIENFPAGVTFCWDPATQIWTITTPFGSTIVEYLEFNLANGETVFFNFDTPGEVGAFLNLIDGAMPTTIDGNVFSSGVIYFVNPAGVMFGPNAMIDVGGLYAAAANIDTSQFASGTETFTVPVTAGGVEIMSGAQINGRLVNLVGRWVHNHGVINVTDGGAMSMIAAEGTVVIQELGDRIAVQINGQSLDADLAAGGAAGTGAIATTGVWNDGTINAQGGQVVLGAGDMYSLAILNDGLIDAGNGGTLQMQALGGTVRHDGDLAASELLTSGDLIALSGELDVGTAQFNDAVVLEGDVTISGEDAATDDLADSVLFLSSVDSDGAGAAGLEVHATTTGFEGAVGADGDALSFLDVTGDLIRIAGGAVTTTGAQSYRGAVELSMSDAMLTGSDILFTDDVWSFTDDVGLVLDGNAEFQGTVGWTDRFGGLDRPLAYLTANGGLTRIAGGGVRTVGTQTYNGAVELAVTDAVLEAPQINFLDDLWALTDDVGLTLDGDVAFNGAVGSTIDGGAFVLRPLAFLEANGAFTRIAGGSVRTVGHQDYAGRVELLLNDATLSGSDIIFRDELWAFTDDIGLALDGDVTFHAAVGSTTLFGDELLRPLASLTTGGGTTTIAGGTVRTVGLQVYNGQVELAGGDVTLTGANVVFNQDLWADASDVGLTIDGDATFGGLVGAESTGGDPLLRPLAYLAANGGLTRIAGGAVHTVGAQTYAGLVQVVLNDAMLTGSEIVFMDDLWAFTTDLDLTLDGDATFMGDVGVVAGADRAFGDLLVTGATTMAGSRILTAGTQTYAGAVALETDVTLDAGALDVQSTISGPHRLTVATDGDAHFADAVDVDDLEITTGGALAVEGTLAATSDITVTTTMGATFAEAITAGGTLFVGTTANPDADVTFGGDLTAGAVTTEVHGFLLFDGANVTATNGDVNLNTGVALTSVPAVATIGSTGDLTITVLDGGDFTMGELQKLTVLGDLVVEGAGGGAVGTATLSDINTLGDMVVNANAILLLAREPGLVLDANGNLVLDLGLDFVAGGNFQFSTTPFVQGSGLVLFASPEAEGDVLGTLLPYSMQAYGGLDRGQFVVDEALASRMFLDLRSQGPANTDVAEAIAAAMPQDEQVAAVASDAALSATVRELLVTELQIQPRMLTRGELTSFAQGRGLYFDAGDTVLDQGSVRMHSVAETRFDVANTTRMAEMLLVMLDDSAAIRSEIARSWERYTGLRGAGAYDIRDYVADAGRNDPATIARLRALNECLDVLRRTGLTRSELEVPEQRVMELFAPPSLGADGLRRVLDVMRAG